MTKVLQNNMTVGELSPDMFARVDAETYYAGLSKAENCVIMPHGGLRRRPGLTKIEDSKVSEGRMQSFEFSKTQDYLVLFTPGFIDIFKDGEHQTQLTSVFTTMEQVKELDAVQSGDVMIITHVDKYPQFLRREGSDTNWAIINVPLSNIPVFDYGTGDEPVWSATRGYPGVCTFFQTRLWFAGSKSNPNSVWGSKINGFYDFDIGEGEADFAVFDTVDTDQFNRIINIYAGRNLQVFTTGSEFYNVAEFVTSETSAWKRSTSYGSQRLKPVMIDGATLFVDKLGRNIRQSVFEFQENAYIAPSISILSEHLISNAVSIDAVKGTNVDISDFVYVVNADGTCAVMNTSRVNKLSGWTQWTTQGDFKDVIVVNNVVYFLVEREGEFHIEYMNEGTTLDHNTVVLGVPKIVSNVSKTPDNVTSDDFNVVFTTPGSGTSITQIDTEESPAIATLNHKVIQDNSVMKDSLGGIIQLERPGYHVEVGLDVPLNIHTMPLNIPSQNGPTLDEIKRVIKVNLNLKDSLGVYANQKYSPDRQFTVVLDEAPKLFSGFKEIYLLGYDRITILEVSQKNPLPLKLLGFGYEVEIK